MLGVTRHALRRIDFRQLRSISRIIEFGFGMRIGCFAGFSVTLQTRIIGYAPEWRMTLVARHFDLIVPVRRRSGQIDRLVLRSQSIGTVAPHEPRDQKPNENGNTRAHAIDFNSSTP